MSGEKKVEKEKTHKKTQKKYIFDRRKDEKPWAEGGLHNVEAKAGEKEVGPGLI